MRGLINPEPTKAAPAKTGLRLLAGLLLVALALLLGLVAAAPVLVERIGLARSLEVAVRDATGHKLEIQGEPHLRLLPQPIIEMGPLALLGDADAQPPLARATVLRLRFAALPLLIGRFELRQAELQGIHLVAEANAVGSQALRWRLPPIEQLGVDDARVRLRYPDESGGPVWSLFAFDKGPIVAGQGGRLDGKFSIRATKPRLDGSLKLDTAVDLVLSETTGFSDAGQGKGGGADQVSAAISQGASESLLRLIRFSDLRLHGSGLTIGEGRGLDLALGADLVDYDPVTGGLYAPTLSLASGALRVDMGLVLHPSAEGAVLATELRLHGFDLRAWMQRHGYGPGRGAPSTMRCAAARAHLVLDGETLSLESVELRLDATHAVGSALLSAPAMTGLGAGPTLLVALALDGLDLDPYLAETGPDEPADGPVSSALAGADCLLPTLARINPPALPNADPNTDASANLIAYFEADKLRVGGLGYGKLAVEAREQGALAGADIEAADFYAGNLSARVERDARDPALPRQTLRAEGVGIDLAALLSDLQGKAPISGIGDIRAELMAAGTDATALKADLSGTLIAEIRDGRFVGLDIGTLVSAVGVDAADAVAATTFSSLSATAVGTGGLFVTEDIDGRSPMLRVSGQGRFDVPAESMDLDLDATFVEGAKGARGLGGIPVPMSISGPWQQPAFRADFGSALREAARRALERNRDRLKQIEERTGIKGLEQGLRGLFGL